MTGAEPPIADLEPRLLDLLERLPDQPGVYLLKDRQGEIVYVGKAKHLSSRVRSYFRPRGSDSRAFVGLLTTLLGDVETIVTANDKEALLLENTLIKQHRPRFNVLMRDDKSFLVLRLDLGRSYPRLEVTRRIADDGALYFGPYHSASSCRELLRVINRHFQLRSCTDRTMASRQRPCLQQQIGRCLAPCVNEVDPAQYAQQAADVTLFLRGRQEALIAGLGHRMSAAADALDFELAARIRDQIEAVRRSLQGQHVIGTTLVDRDVFGLHREAGAVDFSVLKVRGGKLVGQRSFAFDGQQLPDVELLSSFVNQYYDAGEEVPEQVLLPLPVEDAAAKALWLGERRGSGRVEILVPQRGDKRRLLELARRNAESTFHGRRRRATDTARSLTRLQQRLRLSRLPRHIECYDVSSLQGQLAVASLVVLRDGEPDRAAYRHYRVELESSDDLAALYQVLARRLRRARQPAAGWELPDLIVVDGGKGQLSVALAALKDAELPVAAPDLVALAKERGGDPDRVFVAHAKEPVRLRPNTPELLLLARIRDEAHRFAVAHHRKLRRARALRSGLDDIPGIGPKRRRELLRALRSLKAIRAASVEELARVPGMSHKAAEAVVRHYAAARSDGAVPAVSPSLNPLHSNSRIAASLAAGQPRGRLAGVPQPGMLDIPVTAPGDRGASMPANIKIDQLHAASDKDKLNEEWIELVNEGDAPFNAEGCSISVARSASARPRAVTTIKAGLILKGGERVRIVTGSSGKRSHGDAPGDDLRNFHLFLKAPYLDRSGLTIRLANRQVEICRATYGEEDR